MFEKVIFNTFSVCSAKSQSLFLVDPTPRFWLFHSICFEDLMFQKESQIIVYYWYLIFPCKSQTSLQALSLSRDAWDSLSTLFYLMCFRSELDTTLSLEVSIFIYSVNFMLHLLALRILCFSFCHFQCDL